MNALRKKIKSGRINEYRKEVNWKLNQFHLRCNSISKMIDERAAFPFIFGFSFNVMKLS